MVAHRALTVVLGGALLGIAARGETSVSGVITYSSVPSTSHGLDYNNTVHKPVRGAHVLLVDATTNATLAEGATGGDGSYSFSFNGSNTVKVRLYAELVNPHIRVEDNTDGDALWGAASDPFSASGATTLNLNVPSGWGGSSYTGARLSAPFSILDAAYSAVQAFRAVRSPNFPELRINWSEDNRPESGNKATGQIGTSHWDGHELYILGKENVDTDEFDTHVIVHEWSHYFESSLSRADSPGGPHGDGDVLDPRVAMSEGWGNAMSAIGLYPDSVYTDSMGSGQQSGFGFDLEDNQESNPGFFSESSVQAIIYDLFDNESDGPWDRVALGLGPICDVLTTGQRSTPALTTIFSFLDALNRTAPQAADAIEQLGLQHRIPRVSDAFGTGESNDGGFADNLPLYRSVRIGDTVTLTLRGDEDSNRLSQNRYLAFTGNGGSVTITATSDQDVGITVYDSGRTAASADSFFSGTETATFVTTRDRLYIVNITGFPVAPTPYQATVRIAGQ